MKTRLTLLTLALITLISVNSNAQSKYKYTCDLGFGYSLGTNIYPLDRFNFYTNHGVVLNNYFSAGIGVGLDLYDLDDNTELLIPIYVNITGFLSDCGEIKPYMSLDLGYGIGVSKGFEKENGGSLGGLYFTPAIGVKFDDFKFQIGYSSQRFKDEGITENCGSIQFKIGYTF